MENVSPEIARVFDTRPHRRSWAAKAIFAILLLIMAAGALAWFNREQLLLYAAQEWVVSDDLHPADAIVVLGGGVDTRPFSAAEDYRNGLAHRILLTNPRRTKVETLDILPSHIEINRRVLIKLGVPETDIETIGNALSSTFEEGQTLRDWVIRNHARSVIVPTEAFSSRRLRWTLTHALVGTGASVQIQMLDYPDDSYVTWWKTHGGIIEFQNEVMKYLYYRYKY